MTEATVGHRSFLQHRVIPKLATFFTHSKIRSKVTAVGIKTIPLVHTRRSLQVSDDILGYPLHHTHPKIYMDSRDTSDIFQCL